MANKTKATLVGGGIGPLAAAAFMIRDGGVEGRDITVLDTLQVMGGSGGGGVQGAGSAMRVATKSFVPELARCPVLRVAVNR